ncbi:ERF family protein [Fictibacillus halophilus]|uniref:ERF family protein n=1 Tax=Fictibacillus halophilus TaxID=1610490 RepID=UPI00362554A5
MIKSESIVEVAKALVEFNKEMTRIGKDGINPHFKNQYTTLDTMLDTVRPILAKHGLSILQMPSGDGQTIEIRTMILHTSGEYIESPVMTMRPTKTDPQSLGSALTYAKRYSLASVLGISTGEMDDEGNAASVTQSQTYTTVYHKPSYNKATDNQVSKIKWDMKNAAQMYGTSVEKLETELYTKYKIKDITELDKSTASDLIDYLAEKIKTKS